MSVAKFSLKSGNYMSRLAKKPIELPAGVTASMDHKTLTITGPKGSLSKDFRSEISIKLGDSTIEVTLKGTDVFARSLLGTYASHIKNMIAGVTEGYEKKLILEGVGFKSAVSGNILDLALGFSHPIHVEIPKEIKVVTEKNTIVITGVSKDAVGQFASQIRSLKKPEPYKGKGLRYHDEVIRRKQGKKSV